MLSHSNSLSIRYSWRSANGYYSKRTSDWFWIHSIPLCRPAPMFPLSQCAPLLCWVIGHAHRRILLQSWRTMNGSLGWSHRFLCFHRDACPQEGGCYCWHGGENHPPEGLDCASAVQAVWRGMYNRFNRRIRGGSVSAVQKRPGGQVWESVFYGLKLSHNRNWPKCCTIRSSEFTCI